MKAPHSPTKSSTTTKRKRGAGSKMHKRKTAKRKAVGGEEEAAAKPSPKLGKKEEDSARIPQARQVFAIFFRNQNDPRQKFPTKAEIGKALQPDDPLGPDAVRFNLDTHGSGEEQLAMINAGFPSAKCGAQV